MGFSHRGHLAGKAVAAACEAHRLPGSTAEFQNLKLCVNLLYRGVIRKTAAEMFPVSPDILRLTEQDLSLLPISLGGTLG